MPQKCRKMRCRKNAAKSNEVSYLRRFCGAYKSENLEKSRNPFTMSLGAKEEYSEEEEDNGGTEMEEKCSTLSLSLSVDDIRARGWPAGNCPSSLGEGHKKRGRTPHTHPLLPLDTERGRKWSPYPGHSKETKKRPLRREMFVLRLGEGRGHICGQPHLE